MTKPEKNKKLCCTLAKLISTSFRISSRLILDIRDRFAIVITGSSNGVIAFLLAIVVRLVSPVSAVSATRTTTAAATSVLLSQVLFVLHAPILEPCFHLKNAECNLPTILMSQFLSVPVSQKGLMQRQARLFLVSIGIAELQIASRDHRVVDLKTPSSLCVCDIVFQTRSKIVTKMVNLKHFLNINLGTCFGRVI